MSPAKRYYPRPTAQRQVKYLLPAILVLGLILPLTLLVNSPLHHDEALYAYWGRLIASGQDTMLNSVPVDKPPLFIYLLAGLFKLLGVSDTVARLPSILATLATISLTFTLGAHLYDPATGLLAALIVALSPFTILFAPTALTDPLLTALIMGAAVLAVKGRWGWSGVMLALAVATKQQGIFFSPLLVGLLWLNAQNARRLPQAIDQPAGPTVRLIPNANLRRLLNQPFCTFLLTLGVGLLLPLIWDANRLYRPGFWLQSSLSYGGITPAISHVGSRLAGFIDLLRLVTDAPALNLAFGLGLPLLLAVDYRFDDQTAQPRRADGILAGFCLIFILLHALLSFQIWDRYLLGLVPFLALLLARVLHLPAICLKSRTVLWTVAGGLLVISLMGGSVRRAVEAGYPLGGDHGAFAGTAEIGLYLNQHVGANVTLYHRWLGAHWRYYLFNYPYDLHFWQSTADLAQQAAANAAGEQYIAFPAWQSTTPAQLALADVDLQLRPIFYTFRSDGAPAAILYKIEMRP